MSKHYCADVRFFTLTSQDPRIAQIIETTYYTLIRTDESVEALKELTV